MSKLWTGCTNLGHSTLWSDAIRSDIEDWQFSTAYTSINHARILILIIIEIVMVEQNAKKSKR